MIAYIIACLFIISCSKDLSYSAKSEHVIVEGVSKTDEETAKAAAAINQYRLNFMDKPKPEENNGSGSK